VSDIDLEIAEMISYSTCLTTNRLGKRFCYSF